MSILTQNFELLQSRVAGHIAADELIQGEYWEGGKGCFIGCTVHSDDASEARKLFGITEPILRIAESIFEDLPIDEAKAFFAAFPDAIECNGKDLSTVHWQFLAAELRALPEQKPEIQAVIDPVIEGMDLLAADEEWNGAADAAYAAHMAYAACRADAAYAAYWAAYSAARAADAADYAADAADALTEARLRQRDTLLRLIKEAPVLEPKP